MRGGGRWGKPPGVVSDRQLAPWQSDQIALAGLDGAVVEFRRFRLSPTGSTVVGKAGGLGGAVSDVARLQLAIAALADVLGVDIVAAIETKSSANEGRCPVAQSRRNAMKYLEMA